MPENDFKTTELSVQEKNDGSEFSDDSFDELDLEEHAPIDAKCSSVLACASRDLIIKDQ